jgi:hypothetical protein
MAVAYAIPNGGHRSKRVAAELKAEGGQAGVPDIHVLHMGHSYYIQMKRPYVRGEPRGRVSAEQKTMIARLRVAGATVEVAEGLDEAVALLRRWDLLIEDVDWRAAA